MLVAPGEFRQTARQRAAKPLGVPVAGVAIGALVFLMGALVGSADIAALGVIFFAWGLCSLCVLLLVRRLRSAR
jgi:Zn-dependent membrane protease YugP